jgi:hypothetical protein
VDGYLFDLRRGRLASPGSEVGGVGEGAAKKLGKLRGADHLPETVGLV